MLARSVYGFIIKSFSLEMTKDFFCCPLISFFVDLTATSRLVFRCYPKKLQTEKAQGVGEGGGRGRGLCQERCNRSFVLSK